MEIWKLISIVLGAGGFWRLLDVLIKYKSEKRLKHAETKNLYASAQNSIVSNWVVWSQTLEKRVKESEEHTAAMESLIDKQRAQIKKLEQKIYEMEKKNKELLNQLDQLKKVKQNESR